MRSSRHDRAVAVAPQVSLHPFDDPPALRCPDQAVDVTSGDDVRISTRSAGADVLSLEIADGPGVATVDFDEDVA
jgi:hypothetical protein